MSVAQLLSERVTSQVALDVARGLSATPKSLPPYLFYDEAGSHLYERITALPEYYLTRAEHEILATQTADILTSATADQRGPLTVIELGAGTAQKTEVLLRGLARRQTACEYIPIDVSPAALAIAKERLAVSLPTVSVKPLVMTHERALDALRDTPGPHLVLFIGSSVGNFEDTEAAHLLGGIRRSLGAGARVLLGTDLAKAPSVLLPAYDDAAGVTAAFNKNLLTRLNRELGAHFDLATFRHLARWNERRSRIEMHLESAVRQVVRVDALDLDVTFDEAETIHTESSIKYSVPRIERLLRDAGFQLERTFYDERRLFGLHLGCCSESSQPLRGPA